MRIISTQREAGLPLSCLFVVMPIPFYCHELLLCIRSSLSMSSKTSATMTSAMATESGNRPYTVSAYLI